MLPASFRTFAVIRIIYVIRTFLSCFLLLLRAAAASAKTNLTQLDLSGLRILSIISATGIGKSKPVSTSNAKIVGRPTKTNKDLEKRTAFGQCWQTSRNSMLCP